MSTMARAARAEKARQNILYSQERAAERRAANFANKRSDDQQRRLDRKERLKLVEPLPAGVVVTVKVEEKPPVQPVLASHPWQRLSAAIADVTGVGKDLLLIGFFADTCSNCL